LPEGQNRTLLLFHSLSSSLPLSLYSIFPSFSLSFLLSPFTLSLFLYFHTYLSLTLFLLLSDFNEKFLYEGGRKEDLTFIAIELNKRDLKKKKKEKKSFAKVFSNILYALCRRRKYVRILLLCFILSFVEFFGFVFHLFSEKNDIIGRKK